MAPAKQKLTEETREDAERVRLRTRAEGKVMQGALPVAGQNWIPHALRRSNGADIVKRNTSRKKRYLMLFPGGMKLTPGARIGVLDGLATRTPRLTIECGEGCLLLKGFLTFPNNALVLVKGGNSKASVKVIDCFDAAIVFSEWAWVGGKQGNPGSVPEPVPNSVIGGDGSVWKTSEVGVIADSDPPSAKSIKQPVEEEVESISDDTDKKDEEIVPVNIKLADDDDWGAKSGVKIDTQNSLSKRSNPSRRRRTVDYSKFENDKQDSIDDDDDNEDNDSNKQGDNEINIGNMINLIEDDDDDIKVDSIAVEEKHVVGTNSKDVADGQLTLSESTFVTSGVKRKREPSLDDTENVVDVSQKIETDVINLETKPRKKSIRQRMGFTAKRSSQKLKGVSLPGDDLNESNVDKDDPTLNNDPPFHVDLNESETIGNSKPGRSKRRRSVISYAQSSEEEGDGADDDGDKDNATGRGASLKRQITRNTTSRERSGKKSTSSDDEFDVADLSGADNMSEE